MKKIAIVLSVILSALVLVSCASKGTADQAAAPAHHDYKGEVSSAK